jgi:hypothetical protein
LRFSESFYCSPCTTHKFRLKIDKVFHVADFYQQNKLVQIKSFNSWFFTGKFIDHNFFWKLFFFCDKRNTGKCCEESTAMITDLFTCCEGSEFSVFFRYEISAAGLKIIMREQKEMEVLTQHDPKRRFSNLSAALTSFFTRRAFPVAFYDLRNKKTYNL